MPRCLWLTAVTAVTLGQGDSGHEDGNALVRRHALEAPQPQQSLYQAAVDFTGEVHTFKRSRHQDRRSLDLARAARAAASPAVASSSDPRDGNDDVARPPSPARLVAASSVTSPPAADILAFPQTNGGKVVPSAPSEQSEQSDQLNVPSTAPKHKVYKHPVQHRLTMTTLALCMLSSGVLGLLVVWRQGKVLLNKPRRGEDEPDDFQEQVARVLQKRSSQASVRSKDSKGARERSERSQRTSQASSSSAPVVQQVQQVQQLQVETTLEVPEAPEAPDSPDSPDSPAASTVAAPVQFDAEADAAGGGRKNQPKN